MATFDVSSLCSVCLETDSRYTCPACQAKTCSLACSRRHKTRSSCEGFKPLTSFIRKSELQQPAVVAADYRFLEGIQSRLELSLNEFEPLLTTPSPPRMNSELVQALRNRNITVHPGDTPEGARLNKTHVRVGSVKVSQVHCTRIPTADRW
jgi:hypothetical protein